MELAKRLPSSHPHSLALSNAVAPKNSRFSWFRLGHNLSNTHIPPVASRRLPVSLHSMPPQLDMGSIIIRNTLEGISSRHEDDLVVQAAAKKAVELYSGDVLIYTDGSAVKGYLDGGSAAIIYLSHTDPPRTESILKRGAAYTSSFEEECEALRSALTWIIQNCNSRSRPHILSDSQSVCSALLGFDHSVDDLRSLLASCPCTICIQWIPGHKGVPGNVAADAAAGAACQLEEEGRPTSFKGVLTHIKKIPDRDCRQEEKHIETIYSCRSKKKESLISCKWDQVELARLRSGHHWDLHSYRHRCNPALPAHCPRCGPELGPIHNIEHVFTCDNTLALRQRTFGMAKVPISALTDQPMLSLAYARKSLRDVGRPATSQ